MAPPPEQSEVTSEGLSCFWLGAPGDGGRLVLVGELDVVTADRAREAIRQAQDQTRALICDLGDVWFVDFSGLRVLLEAAERARETGARLTIASCPPLVPRMLRLLDLQDALEIHAAAPPTAPPTPHARRSRLSNRPAPRALE